jgi:serine/threonine-protein kinase RsbW
MPNSGQSAYSRNDADAAARKNEISIPSDTKYVKEISSKVSALIAPYKIDEIAAFDIRLCVEEAVINAIVHGNRRDPSKRVKITYWVKDGNLNVEIEDEGNGFNASKLADPTDELNIMMSSGRGVFLINHLMDEVRYNEQGNTVRMVKHLIRKSG